MIKKLYLVRHGQTLFNRKGLIQGWCDSPLTELGHLQARSVRQYFEKQGITFDYVAVSDLGRCEETVKEITDLPYERSQQLREFHYGSLEGEPTSAACKAGSSLDTYYVQFGGETKQQVEDRMYNAIEAIMEKPDVQNVLLVSHGSSSFRFAYKVDARRAKKLRKFSNCVIYVFDFDTATKKFFLQDILDEPAASVTKSYEAAHPQSGNAISQEEAEENSPKV